MDQPRWTVAARGYTQPAAGAAAQGERGADAVPQAQVGTIRFVRAAAQAAHTEWQPGSLTKVVSDGHVKNAYGLAWLEVRPDDAIPGYYLRHGESYVISLRAAKRMSAGVYERVRVLV